MADATVIVTDTQRNVSRTLTTGSSGEYNAPNLLSGIYKVRAEAKGFKAVERQNIDVEIGADLRIDLRMEPGELTQTITVTEAVPMVETSNAELGGTLQSQVIENMPLNGRNFQNMLQLRPGVTMYPGGAGKTQSTNGMRTTDNVYMVNGVMASDPWVAQSIYGNVLAAGDQGTIMPVDAIDEFKTEVNPRAEYGWKPGAIVDVGIKSGTNALHGSAYAYGRSTAFDARNFFNPGKPAPGVDASTFCVLNSAGVCTKQPVELEQYGGTVGGPIKKDKLFYFANFEGQHYGIGAPAIHTTPGNAALIAACETALEAGTLTRLSASMAGLTNTCAIDPSKTVTDAGGVQFQGLFPTSAIVASDLVSVNGIYGGLGKVDYHPSDKHQLEGMYFFSQGNGNQIDNPSQTTSSAWTSLQHARAMVASGSWTYSPRSTVVNEVRFGYGHNFWFFNAPDHNVDPANYIFNGVKYEIPTGITNPLNFGAPRIQFAGFCSGDCIGQLWPKIIGPTSVTEFLEHMSIIRGKHAFKFGGEIFFNRAVEYETSFAKGRLRFGIPGGTSKDETLLAFMEGTLSRAFILQGNPGRDLTNQAYAGFLQDDWRIKPRLTLNLGVRYELNTVVHDRNGQQGNFDPVRGIYQTDNPYHGDHNNFSPRVGFAWDIGGNGKTVLRGGAGILYQQLGMDVLNGQGNLLGLRTIPTGLPLFNNCLAGPPVTCSEIPPTGNITLQSIVFSGNAALNPLRTAWRNFDPTLPVAGQATIYASGSAACGDGINNPNTAVYTKAPPTCEVFGVDPNLRTSYVNNWSLDLQRAITSNLSLDIAYVGNHGTKMLGKLNHNQPAPGAGWARAIAGCAGSAACLEGLTLDDLNTADEQAALPFTAPCAGSLGIPGAVNGPTAVSKIFNPASTCLSYLSYVTIVGNLYDSNYNGLQVTLTGRNFHGLTFTSGYTYSHSLGNADNQGTASGVGFPAPANAYGSIRRQLYANTNFDLRHRFTLSLNYKIPGRKGFGQLLEGWSINSIVLVTSGFPWGFSDASTDFSGTNLLGTIGGAGSQGEQWNFFGNPKDFTPVHGWTDTNQGSGANGWELGGGGLPSFGGTSNATCLAKATAIGPLAVASLASLGCYAVGTSVLIPAAFGSYGTTGQNLFRDTGYKNWDLSFAKMFRFRERYGVEGRAEFFNVLNHPHFANPVGGPGGDFQDPSAGVPFGAPCAGTFVTPDTCNSNPQIGSGGARAMQLGLKLTF